MSKAKHLPGGRRFHVALVEGYMKPTTGSKNINLTAQVLDRLSGCRLIAQFRTEDHNPRREQRYEHVKQLAQTLADQLERECESQ